MMNNSRFELDVQVRWADLDPNGHLRHSVYYDYGAQARIDLLRAQGIDLTYLRKHRMGPILFREECIFRREIRENEKLVIKSYLTALVAGGNRFSIEHRILRKPDTLCATIHIDGAWIDTDKRKLTEATKEIREAFEAWPKSDGFIEK